MPKIHNTHTKTQRMALTGFLIALIVVLQTISALLGKFGFFSITLTLVPIVIGGFLLGPGTGALLGAAFGIITYVFCIIGVDAGGNMLFSANPMLCAMICMVKAILASWGASFVYRLICRKISVKNNPRSWLFFTACAAGLCPIVNTFVFCLGMTFCYKDILYVWAGGTDIAYYMLTGLIGINFVIEFCVNVVLCPLILRSLLKMKMFRV